MMISPPASAQSDSRLSCTAESEIKTIVAMGALPGGDLPDLTQRGAFASSKDLNWKRIANPTPLRPLHQPAVGRLIATVIEIILLDVVAVSGRSGNAEVVFRVFFRCRVGKPPWVNPHATSPSELSAPLQKRVEMTLKHRLGCRNAAGNPATRMSFGAAGRIATTSALGRIGPASVSNGCDTAT
jgi:hypothetical protein